MQERIRDNLHDVNTQVQAWSASMDREQLRLPMYEEQVKRLKEQMKQFEALDEQEKKIKQLQEHFMWAQVNIIGTKTGIIYYILLC
jgi:chromosome segregation ATPase